MGDTTIMLRFTEPDTQVLPSDEVGNLNDLAAVAPHVLPTTSDGFTGLARTFATHGLRGTDKIAGATLATRDISIQTILQWDFAAQNVAATHAVIYARGLGNAANEYTSASIELRVVNHALRVGELRLTWQTIAGAAVVPAGAFFEVPATGWLMLTVTRKWLSPTESRLRFYAADRIIGEVIATGDIGGNVLGTTTVGAKGVAPYQYFYGAIDELRIVDGELASEEIAATWQRIAHAQPATYQALLDSLPPGLPISNDPASRVQRWLRLLGHGLGFASAQDDNFRDNFVPSRAYGDVLASWEVATREAPRPLDSIDDRRARVVTHLRQHAGSSFAGVGDTLAGLLDVAPSQLEILASTNRTEDGFEAIDTGRWCVTPSADWVALGSLLRVTMAAGQHKFDGTANRAWKTCLMAALGNGVDQVEQVMLQAATVPDGGEAGIVIADFTVGNLMLVGVRRTGAVYEIWSENFLLWVSQGATNRGTVTNGNWYLRVGQHLEPAIGSAQLKPSALRQYDISWHDLPAFPATPPGYSVSAFSPHQWVGVYARTHGNNTLGAGSVVHFDNWFSRSGFGQRPNRWYVYRDPALPGAPDYVNAQRALDRIKQSHTVASVCRAKQALCDNSLTGCDQTPMKAP